MISLHDYQVGLVSTDPLVRKVIPHFLHILGQPKVSMYASLADASRHMRKADEAKILMCDGEDSIKDSRSYQLNLKHIFMYVLLPRDDARSCTVEECLDALQGIYAFLEHRSGSFTNNTTTTQDPTTDPDQLKMQYTYKKANPPMDTLTIYRIDKPLTMRGLVGALRATLPIQTVSSDKMTEVTYEMLEKDLKGRVSAYAKELGVSQ